MKKILYLHLIAFYLIHSINSQSQESISDRSLFRDLIVTSVSRNLIAVALELPCDVVITRMQAFNSTFVAESKEIYRMGGILGFYRGIAPKVTTILAKNFYIWPLLGTMPKVYQEILPEEWDDKWGGVTKKILTGLTMATADAIIMTPIDRIKTLQITRQGSSSVFQYMKTQPKGFIPEMMRGFMPTFYGNCIFWVPYLGTDHYLRNSLKDWRRGVPLTLSQILIVSSTLSLMDVGLWLPFQAVKTYIQKEKNSSIKYESTLQVIRTIYHSQGIKGLYCGWRLEIVRTFFMTIFNTYFFDQLESK